MATTYYVRVHIESAGTDLTNGWKSLAGHMWYETYQKDENGTVSSQRNSGYTSDGIVDNDKENYLGDPAYSSKEILLTQEQFDKLQDFGNPDKTLAAEYGFGNDDYWVHSNSCIDYLWKGLEIVGLNPAGTEGALWPSANMSLLGAYLFGDFAYSADNHSTIPSDMNGLFNSAQGWMPPRRGDPLVLDIDGDGIETIQIDTNSPILFDHDSDGVKIATGWVKSDDALLVLDRNANGTIDNGSELFGDQTLVNGVKATDGFAALSAEDSNNMLISFIKPISNNSLYKANLQKMA